MLRIGVGVELRAAVIAPEFGWKKLWCKCVGPNVVDDEEDEEDDDDDDADDDEDEEEHKDDEVTVEEDDDCLPPPFVWFLFTIIEQHPFGVVVKPIAISPL